MNNYFNVTNKSFGELGVATYKELWDKVKGEYKGLTTSLETVFTKASESENKFHVVFSTENEDRHGDIVFQNWDLKSFKKNPVFLDSHNYNSIEHILGRVVSIGVKDNQLQGDVEFALDNPKGLLAYKLAQTGFLNTTSVGFIPKEFDEQGNIIKSELLEISAVSVPANAEALFEKAKSLDEAKVVIQKEVPVSEPQKISLTNILAEMKEERRRVVLQIAECLKDMTPVNEQEKSRKMFKTLRGILSKDKN